MTTITSQQVYTNSSGTTSTNPFITVIKTVPPTPQDVNYFVGQRWIVNDAATGYPEYFLIGFLSSGGVITANWVSTSVSIPATVATSYVTDSGTAIPAANVLNVVGGPGCMTQGSGSTITVTVVSAGFPWTEITSLTQTIVVDNGYITSNVAGVSYVLPASATQGQAIVIVGKSGITSISQNAGQQILMGTASSTVGVTGFVSGTDSGDCIELICITAGVNTVWRASNWVGNWVLT